MILNKRRSPLDNNGKRFDYVLFLVIKFEVSIEMHEDVIGELF